MSKDVIELSVKHKAGIGKKRLAIGGVALVVSLGALFYGSHWYTTGRFMEDTDDAYVGGNVTVISPKVAGNITEILVGDNQVVHAGDVLVRIDNRDYVAALDKAKAAVAAEEAALANVDATSHLQEALIDQAKAGITGANAETSRAHDDQSRYQDLSAKEAVAQRDLAVLNVSYTELRAPIDGVIGNRRARLGAYATVGGQLLAVVPAQGLWVDANFKENQLVHVHPGAAVNITADVLPGEVFHGHVASLAPATGAQFSILPAENATGNFTKIVQRVPVRVVLDGEGAKLGKLRPGLSVTAEVDDRPVSGSQS